MLNKKLRDAVERKKEKSRFTDAPYKGAAAYDNDQRGGGGGLIMECCKSLKQKRRRGIDGRL